MGRMTLEDLRRVGDPLELGLREVLDRLEPPPQRALPARRGAVPHGSLRHRSGRHPRPGLREGHGAEGLPQGGGRRPRVLDRGTRRRRGTSLTISVPGPDSTSIGTPGRPTRARSSGRGRCRSAQGTSTSSSSTATTWGTSLSSTSSSPRSATTPKWAGCASPWSGWRHEGHLVLPLREHVGRRLERSPAPPVYGRPARRHPSGVAPWARLKVLTKYAGSL